MTRRLALALAIVPLLALGSAPANQDPAPAGGAEATPEWEFERFHHFERLPAGSRLELLNEHGDLRTRAAGDGRIEIVANFQRHFEDARAPQVEITETDGGLVVRVVYRQLEESGASRTEPPGLRGRTDLTVLVPAGVDVSARTADGLLELKGIDGAIDGTSVGGDVVVSTAGAARIVSEAGEIRALFKSTGWESGSELRTGSGTIAVWLPPDADVTVSGETSGEITTDYTLVIDRLAATSRKRARARIGTGAAELRLHSRQGALKILRSH